MLWTSGLEMPTVVEVSGFKVHECLNPWPQICWVSGTTGSVSLLKGALWPNYFGDRLSKTALTFSASISE